MNILTKLATPIMKLDALDNLSTVLTNFNEKMKTVGPLLGGAALIVTILMIIFAGEKRTGAYVKKAIIICVCIVLISNYANIIPMFEDLFNQIFPGS